MDNNQQPFIDQSGNTTTNIIDDVVIVNANGDEIEKLTTSTTAQNIINYNIEYPLCSYSKNTRRTMPTRKQLLIEKIEMLTGWHEYDVISLDGQNGTTKSTLCRRMMRTYRKINELAPEITCGSNYNFDPLRSLEYMCLQLSTESHDSVWDRCVFSNLIFYYVHHLMYKFRYEAIPIEPDRIWPIFNMLAINTNLMSTIDYCRRINNIPTIFFVCRNVDYISKTLHSRAIASNSVNDLWNCKEYNYQMAQYHAYVWFGKLLDYPVFDLEDFLNENLTLDDMHTIIASKVDRLPTNSVCNLPDRTDAKLLNDLLLPLNDDVLIFDYSRK